MVKIKICGLKSLDEVRYVNELQPDYVGFVFAPGRHQITLQQAGRLREKLDSKLPAVGVFVKEELEVVERLCHLNLIQIVQLHGEESLDYLAELKQRISQPIIYAVRARGLAEVERAMNIPAEYLLIDTYVKGLYGGTGESIDPEIIPTLRRPCFLAGGITPDNVGRLVERFHPYGIDVSSGVETDGSKDYEKMRRLCLTVRSKEEKNE